MAQRKRTLFRPSEVQQEFQLISEKPYMIRLLLPGVPAATNDLLGAHWKRKSQNANRWKNMVWKLVDQHLPKEPLKKAKITIKRYGVRMLDYDGLVASAKPVIDGLVQVRGKGARKGQILWPGVLYDDGWGITGRWDVDQFKAEKGREAFEIFVEELDEHGGTSQAPGGETQGSGKAAPGGSHQLSSRKVKKELSRAKGPGHQSADCISEAGPIGTFL